MPWAQSIHVPSCVLRFHTGGVGDAAAMADAAQPPGMDRSTSRKFNFSPLLLAFQRARGESAPQCKTR